MFLFKKIVKYFSSLYLMSNKGFNDNSPWITAPRQSPPWNFPRDNSRACPPPSNNYPPILLLDNYSPDHCPLVKFPLGQLLTGRLPSGQLPINNSPRTTTSRTIAPHQVPPWITIEIKKCFKLSRFESELPLREASTATEDSSRRDIVNPLSEWPFSTFFNWCCVIKSWNQNMTLAADYLSQYFNHMLT